MGAVYLLKQQIWEELPDLAQQNGSSSSSQTANLGGIRRSWYTDPDIYSVRQQIIERILHVFNRPISSEWQQRVPDLVKRLEEALLKEATSKEDYMNMNTLERRLQSLMKRFQHGNRNQNHSHHSPLVRTMIPTPGLQQSGNASAMIPIPGTDISTVNGFGTSTVVPNTVGIGKMLPNSNENASLLQGNSLLATENNSSKMVPTPGLSSNAFPISGDNISSLPGPLNNGFQSQQSISTGTGTMMPTIGMARIGSQMIPTPGMNTPQSMLMSSACAGGLGHSNIDALPAAQQHQFHQHKQQQLHQHQQQLQFNGGQNNRIYHNINGQIGGTIGINTQQKNSSYGLLNEAALSYQMNSLVSDGYAMNAADLSGPGNLFNPATSGGVAAGSNFNSNSFGLQPKMIPVPGLSPQQSNLHTQQQVQQHKSQGLDHSPQINFQLPRGQLIPQYSQQLQQPDQQNMQHQPPHQQQYQQQHHNHQQNQQTQPQQQLLLKSEDAQQIQLTSKLSGQKHLGTGLQPQNEALQHHIPQASNEQLQPQVMGTQIQPSQSGGLPMHQDWPTGQQLSRQLSQKSQQQQVPSPQQQQQSQSQNDSNSFPIEVQPEAVLQGLQESQSQEKFQVSEQAAHSEDRQQLRQEIEQSMAIDDDAQKAEQQHQSSVSGTVSTITNQTRVETSSGATGSTGQPSTVAESRQQQYIKQQRWLLFLRHASKCSASEGECLTIHCPTAQRLWAHITKCRDSECTYSRCQASRTLLRHHQNCRDLHCPVCGPVRQIILQQRLGHVQSSNSRETSIANGVRKFVNANNRAETSVTVASTSGNPVQQQSQSQNDSNSFPIEVQPEAVLQGLQESQSQEKFQVSEQVAHSEDRQQLRQEIEQFEEELQEPGVGIMDNEAADEQRRQEQVRTIGEISNKLVTLKI